MLQRIRNVAAFLFHHLTQETNNMKIIIPKTELSEALCSLSRIACVANPILPATRLVRIQADAKKQSVVLSAGDLDQALQFTLPNAKADADVDITVSCAELKNAIKGCGSAGDLTFAIQDEKLIVLNHELQLGILNLAPQNDAYPFPAVPKNTDSQIILPTNFTSFLANAQICTSTDPTRKILQGICIAPDGVTSSNGQNLYHVPLPLSGLPSAIILNFNRTLCSIRQRWLSLATWKVPEGPTFVAIRGEHFLYVTKSVDGIFPNWRQVVPEAADLDCAITLPEADRELLKRFLELVETKTSEHVALTVEENCLKVIDATGRTVHLNNAEVKGGQLPCTTHVKAEFLLKIVKFGHDTLTMNTRDNRAMKAEGGAGFYVFMGCVREEKKAAKPEVVQQPVKEQVPATAVPQANSPIPPPAKEESTSTTTPEPPAALPVTVAQITIPTTNREETSTMQNIAMIPRLPAPSATTPSTSQDDSTDLSPLEEANQYIEALRDEVKGLGERLNLAGRKLKEALLSQRQMERRYASTSRKLERIRQASGF
jgi:DNA polymerase III sliding clamp (beta) subunit (PCNA family)